MSFGVAALPSSPLLPLTPADTASATHFERASLAVVPIAAAASGPPPTDSPLWQPVALPNVVRRTMAVQPDSTAGRSMGWYRVSWSEPLARAAKPPASGPGPMGVYVPRAISGPLQVWRLDGEQWRLVFDNSPWRLEQWNRPVLVPLDSVRDSKAVAPDRPLTLAVGASFRDDRFHAMSTLWVGPLAELQPRANMRTLLQLSLPEAASIAMVALGAMSLAVWSRRRHEGSYLYFGLASIVWPLRNLHQFIDLPRDPIVNDWFWWMTAASVSWVMLAMYFFALRFVERRFPTVERLLIGFVVAGGLLTVPWWGYDALLLQHALNLGVALLVTGLLSVLSWRGGSRELRMIVAALWISFAFAVHDWLLVAMLITPESVYLLPYGSMVVIGSALYAAMRRFVSALEQVESANVVLASKLAGREQELEHQHARLRSIEREQAVLLERQRLMREMHDGVGSTLIATLRVIESDAYSREGVVDLLRMAIEDLRLAIDSLEPIEHDLATLLATLRMRVGRRLEAAGLRIQWAMDDLPALPWLDAGQALQVLRLMQEALTNVIKHADAREVRISATVSEGDVLVCVADDGRGFDSAAAPSGRGLASMQHRALALGAGLVVESAVGRGVVVSVRLPLSRVTDNS